jgi:hypothetical protein
VQIGLGLDQSIAARVLIAAGALPGLFEGIEALFFFVPRLDRRPQPIARRGWRRGPERVNTADMIGQAAIFAVEVAEITASAHPDAIGNRVRNEASLIASKAIS